MTTPTTSTDWLKDTTRTNPAVLDHLASENTATDAALAPLADLKATLVEEFITRAKIDRRTPDVVDGDYAYYAELDATASQSRHMRRHILTGTIEILLDEEVAAGGEFYDLGTITISDDHTRMLWTEDRTGDEFYGLTVKDLTTGEILARFDNIAANALFNIDGTKVVYKTYDDAHRPHQVWAYDIPTKTATLLYQEDDERFWLSLDATRDEQWIVINSESSQTTAEHILVERSTLTNPTVFTPRVDGIYTMLDAFDGYFWIVSNHRRRDNELFTGTPGQPANEWHTVYTPDDGIHLLGFDLFAHHMAFEMRYNGFNRVAVAKRNGNRISSLAWLESSTDASTTTLGDNPMAHSPYLHIETSDWTTPDTTIRYRLEHETGTTATSARTIIHTEPVPGYNADLYTSELRWVASEDGTRVPYSLIRRKDTNVTGTHLWAYGSYGISEDPGFVDTWVSLLDRGIACAVAYPRGGSELGRHWYDNGKLEYKQNTFKDMEAVAKDINTTGFGPIALRGGSAGGLMVGATINRAPEQFAVAIAEVPFVDALATMLDPTLPLTIGEYEEWGNPEDPEVYDRIKAYSPVDNVSPRPYPAVLATAGLHDPRVGYWEPAKWVIKLRESTTTGKPVLFRCEMSGHGGSTGRWDKYSERAEIMAFIIDQLQKAH